MEVEWKQRGVEWKWRGVAAASTSALLPRVAARGCLYFCSTSDAASTSALLPCFCPWLPLLLPCFCSRDFHFRSASALAAHGCLYFCSASASAARNCPYLRSAAVLLPAAASTHVLCFRAGSLPPAPV